MYKVKRAWCQVQGNQAQVSKSLFQESHKMCQSQQWVANTHVKCCLPETLVRESVLEDFVGGWSGRHPLPHMPPNFRLPGGKSALCFKYKPCCSSEQFRHSETTLGKWWDPPQIQVTRPVTKGQALWVGWEEDQGINLSWYFKILSCQILITSSLCKQTEARR